MATPPTTTPPTRKMVLCMVTGDRGDATLQCAMSLLRFQTTLATHHEPLHVDMHFVRTLDDALNALWAAKDAEGCAVVRSSIGFDAQFVLRSLNSGRDVVAGVYPLAVVDWDRVASQPPAEPPSHWGNKYNVTPVSGETEDGYVTADATDAELGLVWVRRAVLESIVARHPGVLTADGDAGAFAAPGVYGGRRVGEHARFLELYAGPLAADVRCQAVNTGPTEFGGAVGARKVLR